jgi:hypothetical protein
MTYDPYRYNDLEPYSVGVVIGAVIVFGALMFGVIVGFIFVGPSDLKLATNDIRPPITQHSNTGSSANMPPAPQPELEPVKPPLPRLEPVKPVE